MTLLRTLLALLILSPAGFPQDGAGPDLDKLLEKADLLLEEAKAGYEDARANSSVPRYLEAGFKLEEARIKYLVLQEIGSPEKQKIAADRTRAVNQLTKLINDGRLAITERRAETAPEAPAAEAPPTPAMKASEVTTRSAVPDPAKQKDAAKVIRDLFKDQYAKKAPADRKALARTLLDQAMRSTDDRTAQWVLFQESADVAAQGGDLEAAFEAIDGTTRFFDVDAMPLKHAALTTAGKTATAPGELAALATALDRMVDQWIAEDQYDSADKSAALALQYARRAKDAPLTLRLTQRTKEVADAKAKFRSMKKAIETLARNPDDPAANAEMGQFLCFVKGSWDLGLRFLAKGNDAALRALAERELKFPTSPEDLVALGDGWWELAAKEKSAPRKLQLQSHLKVFYDDALASATGLLRIRIEKRLVELEDAGIGGVDLLRTVDPKTHTVKGGWRLEGRTLVGYEGGPMCLMIPYQPPDEYDLTVVLTRREGGDAIVIGLVGGGAQFILVLDGHAGLGGVSGLELLDGKYVPATPDAVKGRQVHQDKTVTLLCAVRKAGLTVQLNGKKLVDYQGGYGRLTLTPFYQVPNPKALLLGGWGGKVEFNRMTLQPVGGQGKRLR